MKKAISVTGVTSRNGNEYVRIRKGSIIRYIPFKDFAGNYGDVKKRLANDGLPIVNRSEWKHLVSKVEVLEVPKDFPPKALFECPGWTDGCFALANGTVIGPKGTKGKPLYARDHTRIRSQGTLAGWQATVAEPIAGQHFLVFMLMSSLAAPILSLTSRVENFGFEIVGGGGKGKSTALRLAATVYGAGNDDGGHNFWQSCNQTIRSIELSFTGYSHLPLLLDETNLFLGSRSTKAIGDFRQLIFALASGRPKGTFFESTPPSFRTVFITTTNESGASIFSNGDAATNAAAGDRLISLTIDERRPHNSLDRLPLGEQAGPYVDRLELAAKDNYGTAGPAFLKALVAARASDEAALRVRIKRHVDEFKRKVGADPNDGSASRVAEAFGIVYAAGMLAKAYGVLPKGFRCLAAAKTAYRMNRPIPEETIMQGQLAQLLSAQGLKKLTKGKRLLKVSDKTFNSTAVFKHTGKGGRQELLVSPRALRAIVPNALSLLKRAIKLNRLHHPDKGHNTVHKHVRKNKRDRMHCFLIDSL